MQRATAERLPVRAAPGRSRGAAFERADPGPAIPPMTEQQRQVKRRSRAAAQKLAAQHAQVKEGDIIRTWYFVYMVYDTDTYTAVMTVWRIGACGWGEGGCTRCHAWPYSYDRRTLQPYTAGTDRVGFPADIEMAPSAKRREVFCESHEG